MKDRLFTQLIQECRHSDFSGRLSCSLRCSLERLPLSERKKLVSRLDGRSPPLWIAARRGNSEIVEYLVTVCGAPLEQHGELRLPDARHSAPSLWIAAISGHTSTCTRLLNLGADVESRSSSGSTALRSAVHCGHEAVVWLLLSRGADPNAASHNGSTPLINAVHSPSLCVLLLEYGASVKLRDVQGRGPLEHAAAAGQLPVVDLLLKTDAEPACKQLQRCDRAMYAAAVKGHGDIVRLLSTTDSYTMREIAGAYDLAGAAMLDQGFVDTALYWWRAAKIVRGYHPRGNQLLLPPHNNMEALVLYATDATAKALGPTHTATIARIVNKGRMYVDMGRPDLCVEAMTMALRLQLQRDSLLHSKSPCCLSTLTKLLQTWSDVKYAHVMGVLTTLADALPEWFRLVNVAPQCLEQARCFDSALQCAVKLMNMCLDTFITSQHLQELRAAVTTLVRSGIRSIISGDTALHAAARLDLPAAAELLLRCGAAPDERNLARGTALHAAARHTDSRIAEVLVKGGVHRDTPNRWGDVAPTYGPPLPLACHAARSLARHNLCPAAADLPPTLHHFLELHRP